MYEQAKQTGKTRASWAIVVGISLASGTAILVKSSFSHGADPLGVIALRMLFSLPLFFAVGVWHFKLSKHRWKSISWRKYAQISLVGVLGYYLTSYTNFIGLQYISASLERIIMFIYPTFVLILSALFFGNRIKIVHVIAIKITYLGLIISFASQAGGAQSDGLIIGVGMVVLSALLFASNLVFSRGLVMEVGAIPVTVVSFVASGVLVLLQFGVQRSVTELVTYQNEVYINAGIMAVCTTLLPSLLMGYALKYLSAVEIAIITCIGPPVGFLLAVIFLHESISTAQILGSFVVILGVLFLQYSDVKTLAIRVLKLRSSVIFNKN